MNRAHRQADRAGGPADLSRDASQPEALIPCADELRRRAITAWWGRQALYDFIERKKAERK